ncbi:MAG: hypothetical protein WBV69_14860 [Candidatus Sulfotelmatobacter sp.]
MDSKPENHKSDRLALITAIVGVVMSVATVATEFSRVRIRIGDQRRLTRFGVILLFLLGTGAEGLTSYVVYASLHKSIPSSIRIQG